MAPIRVLVVDDSAFARTVLTRLLNSDPDIEVVGQAADGYEALEKAKELRPDVITLDVTMPRMDGLETIERLMKETPTPTVMVSALTQAGAEVTLEALARGAVDFVPKIVKSGVTLVQDIGSELVAKVKAAAGTKVRAGARAPVMSMPSRPLRAWKDRVVIIASSTGGPQALCSVIPRLPKDLGVPVVLVQHLPAAFTPSFAKRLDSLSELHVEEAHRGSELRPGLVLLAPGGFHLKVTKGGLVRLENGETECGVKPAANVAMESIAEGYGRRAIAVVLTGMGSDGTRGAGLIKQAGGQVLAEAEQSCVIYGMPRSVFEAGHVDKVVDLKDMADEIVGLCVA